MFRARFLILIVVCSVKVAADSNSLGDYIHGALVKPASEALTQSLMSSMDSELTHESYNYKGIDVHFSHQRWTVKNSSVCERYKANSAKIGQCTLAAADLFELGCNQFKSKGFRTSKDDAEMRMYCNASKSFKPTVITSSGKISNTSRKSRLCNQLIAESLGSNDPVLVGKRNKACSIK